MKSKQSKILFLYTADISSSCTHFANERLCILSEILQIHFSCLVKSLTNAFLSRQINMWILAAGMQLCLLIFSTS